jgi:hypothetical protein
MREVEIQEYDDLPEDAVMVDWKVTPDKIFEEMDTLLKPHKLQMVVYETGGDDYCFSVEPLE